MVFGRKAYVTLGVLAAFLLLLVGLLTVPALAQETDENPIDGSTAEFERTTKGDITRGAIDVSEFESCEVEEGATITVEDDDGTRAVFEDLKENDGNAATAANSEITYEGDEIVIEPQGANNTITPRQTQADISAGLQGDAEVIASTGISCMEAEDDNDDNGNVVIDDRDQSNVCNQVVNIVLENVQNPNVNNTQYADVDVNTPDEPVVEPEVGDEVGDEQAVTVTQEQVVDIAQELNISPVIVQTCIQQNAGEDAIIVNDDDDDNGDNTNGGTDNGGTDPDEQNPVTKPDGVVNAIGTEELPVTGGPDYVVRGIALSIVLSGVAFSVLLLVKSRRRRT